MVSQLRTRCHGYAIADSWLRDVATSRYDGGVTLVAGVYLCVRFLDVQLYCGMKCKMSVV